MGIATEEHKHVVVLVHGFNKQRTDMATLRTYLQKYQWSCLSWDLPTLFGDLEHCTQTLAGKLVADLEQHQAGPITLHFVAHSMGGLICRQLIHEHLQTFNALNVNLGHCVFIATPHQGTRLANYADWIPLYHRTFKPLRALTTALEYPRLPHPRKYKLGLIAGSRTAFPFSLLLKSPNDGRVEVTSVRADDSDDFVVLPYTHHQLHHHNRCCQLTEHFLRYGFFLAEQTTK